MRIILVAFAALLAVAAACGDDAEEASIPSTTVAASPTETTQPAPTSQPSQTPVSGEVSWQEVSQLLKNCRVASVMQTHALDIYIVLDDGTEVHAKEPGIDDIFDAIGGLPPGCGPESVATE